MGKDFGRALVDKKGEEINIEIPAYQESSKTNLLMLWLLAFTVCGAIVIAELFKPQTREFLLYVFIFLAFWLYFELKILKAYRWRKYGKEKIRIADGKLIIVRETAGRGIEEVYELEQVRNFRKTEKKQNFTEAMSNSYWIISGAAFSFDHYGKLVMFGLQLNEQETAGLFKLIKHQMKEA